MQKIAIEIFLALAQQYPVLDVRSPAEYGHAHIPMAYNLPLFTDEERKVVGTAYKLESREQAIKIGLDYFGPKMRRMVEDVEQIIASRIEYKAAAGAKPTVLVHCWRGGMRSAGVAWLLDLYGFKVYTLDGGYKAFRNRVLQQFEQHYNFKLLGGYTGSGKTQLLASLSAAGEKIIDLESIAQHKGSAFGALGEDKQPSQEMFENKLGLALQAVVNAENIWVEDESQRIGNINLPNAIFKHMHCSCIFFLEIPFEERLIYLTEEYGKFEKQELQDCILRIQKRLGAQNAKEAVAYLQQNDNKECFRILLRYYDKYYERSIKARDNISALLTTIPCEKVDAEVNTLKLLDKTTNGSTGRIN